MIKSKPCYPKITIVTPSYNQGDFLEECILSIINQNYPNLEYFIYDGLSTDNSVDIIKNYQKHITYWISEEDNGQSEVIGKGFSRATGDLLLWLNSDDVLFPNALFKVAEAYRKVPDAALYSGGIAKGKSGNMGIDKIFCPPPSFFWFIRNNAYVVGQMGTFINKTYYDMTSGMNSSFVQIMDRDIFYKVLKVSPSIKIVHGLIAFIRFHEEARSSNKYPENRKTHINEINMFYKEYNINKKVRYIFMILYRIGRAISGSYLISLIYTLMYRNKKMKIIWENYLN